jgi:hypothetical protein
MKKRKLKGQIPNAVLGGPITHFQIAVEATFSFLFFLPFNLTKLQRRDI